MHKTLSEAAKRVMALAADEARALNHDYVGTEHILLGLLHGDAGGTLQRLGLNSQRVRSEVAKLVSRGPQASLRADLPLTPRAGRVIELASEEATCVSLPQVEPEHLLIGLVRQLDGVAGLVMKKLGLQTDRVRAEALKVRALQIRLVERAVRPVRAGIKHKRKMREELLAHLTAIYREELVHASDPLEATEAAARRFGDPAELSREFQSALPASARVDYHLQRWMGWRAPESVLRMMARTSALSFFIIVAVLVLPALVLLLFKGWDQPSIVSRLLVALSLLTPAAQFATGLCYFKVRDALWGVFGARRSRLHALLWSIVSGFIVVIVAMGFVVSVEGTNAHAIGSLPMLSALATLTAVTLLLQARTRGQTEICDTIWETLDLS